MLANKPAADSANPSQSSDMPSIKQQSLTVRVLLVDDHEYVRRALAEFLLLFSPRIDLVGEAGDGETALAMTRTTQPDVAIMDIGMPGMKGIEVTRHITREHPRVKVMGLSNFSEGEKVGAMISAGAVRYLHKTVPPEILIEAILACASRD